MFLPCDWPKSWKFVVQLFWRGDNAPQRITLILKSILVLVFPQQTFPETIFTLCKWKVKTGNLCAWMCGNLQCVRVQQFTMCACVTIYNVFVWGNVHCNLQYVHVQQFTMCRNLQHVHVQLHVWPFSVAECTCGLIKEALGIIPSSDLPWWHNSLAFNITLSLQQYFCKFLSLFVSLLKYKNIVIQPA